jgi:hypothetical protein
MRWYAAWLSRGEAMGSSPVRAARSQRCAGAGAGWGQAQQQHRMTPPHMEPMCMRNAAVVEDMAPVEHDARWAVHGDGSASRRPDEVAKAAREARHEAVTRPVGADYFRHGRGRAGLRSPKNAVD